MDTFLTYQTIPALEVLARLRRTRLKGYDRPYVYQNASLEIIEINPDNLVPAQRYVLSENLRKINQLYQLFKQQAVDIFALQAGLSFWTHTQGSPIPLLPPIVEESLEERGKVLLINDGMHRIYTARRLKRNIHVILVKNVPAQYPYYAYPLPQGWQEVVELEELPAQFVKKTYRDKENYKALFRDFNELFPAIQKERPILRS